MKEVESSDSPDHHRLRAILVPAPIAIFAVPKLGEFHRELHEWLKHLTKRGSD